MDGKRFNTMWRCNARASVAETAVCMWYEDGDPVSEMMLILSVRYCMHALGETMSGAQDMRLCNAIFVVFRQRVVCR